ncbi:MAG: hypothetical protein A2Z24_02240 [Candidatus Woykebacteria bacterium RBG_16_44_10]|uniref:DNA polymerase III delta N-terminal domain-containing protein n=1 Tax=Candidatus Woykebacteria bacterium RBG_16_44_10 TaxID=1802597 RepID=A0A1G1WH84_9BACT|nr:MAG: hypothetical protein A2Z24_02240 [Candidatus Woykebacteria bacterium RBG_16_44_10]
MIYLIHGTNQVDSRRFLIRLKGSYQDIQTISGKGLSKEVLEEKLKIASHHLFGGKSSFLIEHFSGDWNILPKKLPEETDIILWSGGKVEIGKTLVKSFLFDQRKKATTFRLVDAILFKDEKESQSLALELISAKEPIEKIIGAVLRGLLLAFCAKDKDDLRETPLSSFVQQKIKEQAKNWTRVALKKAILELLRADVALKESRAADLILSQFINRAAAL